MNPSMMSRREMMGMAGAGVIAGRLGGAIGHRGGAARILEIPPVDEIVNLQQFEDIARQVLEEPLFAAIAGGDRGPFDYMSFRPRQNVPTLDMDLGISLFGQTLFTPLLVGPIAGQHRFHSDGEIATVRGAAAANTVVILPARSTIGVSEAAAAGSPVWVNVYADEPAAAATARTAVEAGAGVVFITVGASYLAANAIATAPQTAAQVDWNLVESIRRALDVPVVAKGIMNPAAAVAAVDRGFSGLVVSNHAAPSGNAGPMNVLAGIVDAVEGRVPVLVDGSFRRGTDVMKALILGADAALLARPVAWGLAAYGADGVSRVIQLVQNELARSMAMLGASTPAQLTRTHLRIHTRATS